MLPLAARLSWVGISAAAVDSIPAAVIFKVHHRPTLHHRQLFVLRPCSIGMAMRVASAFRRALGAVWRQASLALSTTVERPVADATG